MKQYLRLIFLSALCVVFGTQLVLCAEHTRGEASHVQFKLEKVPESDTMYESEEPSMMQSLSENLQAAKDSISSTIGLKGHDVVDDAKYKAQKAANKASEMKDNTVDTLSDKARNAMESLQEKMQEARDTISNKLYGAADTAEAKAEQGKANLQSMGDKISSKASELKNDAATNLEQAKDSTKESLHATYLRMKEAYERLTARMNELKHDTEEKASDIKADLQDKATDAANKAQHTAHDIQSKSKDTVYQAKESVDHAGNRASRLFTDAYNSIHDTFTQLGARLRHSKPEVEEEKPEGVAAGMRDSYEKLAARMGELSLAAKSRLGMQGDTVDVANSDIYTKKLNVQELTDRIESDLPTRNALYNYITEAYFNVRENYNKMMGHDADSHHYQVQNEKAGVMDSTKEKVRSMGETISQTAQQVGDRVADTVGYKTKKNTDRGL